MNNNKIFYDRSYILPSVVRDLHVDDSNARWHLRIYYMTSQSHVHFMNELSHVTWKPSHSMCVCYNNFNLVLIKPNSVANK